MKGVAAFTLVLPERIAHARVLFASLARHQPTWERHVFVIDRPDVDLRPFADALAIQRSVEELSLTDLQARFIWYNHLEATRSLKASGFRRLFADGYDQVVYLDPEILIYSPLREAEEALSRNALVLSPHPTRDLSLAGFSSAEPALCPGGAFTGSFLAMRDTPECRSFLDWWERMLSHQCLRSKGYDEASLSFAPCFVNEHANLPYPAYGLPYRHLFDSGLSWTQDGSLRHGQAIPVRFLRFDELDWRQPLSNSSFSAVGPSKVISELVTDYGRLLREEGVKRWSLMRPRLGLSGEWAIPDFLREWLRQEPSFRATAHAGWQGGSIEEGVRQFLLLPDRVYPWLPIFLARTFDSLPWLRTYFPCDSGFFLQDFSTWFEGMGQRLTGFGSLYPSQGWWTEEEGVEKHLRRAIERWLKRKKSRLPKGSRFFCTPMLRQRILDKKRKEPPRLCLEEKPLLHVYGYFHKVTGLAEAARGTVRALERLGYPHRAIHVDDESSSPEFVGKLPLSLPGKDAHIDFFHVGRDKLPALFTGHPEIDHYPKFRIAYWPWELLEPPPEIDEASNLVDEFWCPSEFNRKVFQQATRRQVRVAWHNLDLEAMVQDADPSIGEALGFPGKCAFLTLADFYSDPWRKNPLLALRAYLGAFPKPEPDRLLCIKLKGVDLDPAYLDQLRNEASERPDICLSISSLPPKKLLGLLVCATSLISLHASEGFGLPIAEMLSLGKPVVATGYSGNMDFCSTENSRLVGYRLVPITHSVSSFRRGALWAEPHWEEAVHHLQAIYQEWKEGMHRTIKIKPWINERSFAMYAENLRAVEQRLRSEAIEIRSRR